jgi:hypothetical protein
MSANTKMVLIAVDRYEELMATSHTKKSHNGEDMENKSPDVCSEKLTENNILEFIPTDFREKVKLIFRHMKTHDMTWDNCGRLVMDNDCVLDANVIEVIKDVVTTNNKVIESKASKQFYKLLILTNFPVSLLTSITNDEEDKESTSLKPNWNRINENISKPTLT